MSTTFPSAQDISTLLDQLETMPHHTRQREIAIACHALGQHGATDRLEDVLAQLRQGDVMMQRLAVTGAIAGRHTSSLHSSALAPSLHVRRYALRSLCAQPDALPHIIKLLDLDIAHVTDSLLSHLRLHQRHDIAPLLIEELRRQDRLDSAASLLPLCRDLDVLTAQLDTLDEEIVPLASIAKRQPAFMLAYLDKQLKALGGAKLGYMRTWNYLHALSQLVTHDPEHVAHLAAAVMPPSYSIHSHTLKLLRSLARHAPEATLRILIDPARRQAIIPQLPRILKNAFHQWPHAMRQEILNSATSSHSIFASLLTMLPPCERAAHLVASWPDEERATLVWSDDMMRVLPHALRQQEAARCLAIPAIQDARAQRLRFTSYLHLDESRDKLLAATRGSQSQDRATGWEALIHAHSMARVPLHEVLTHTSRLINEQDPVRLAALQAIAVIPGSRFVPQDGEHLLELARFIVEARDTSWGTRSAMLKIFKGLMTAHSHTPDSSLLRVAFEGILMLAQQAGILDMPSLADHISDETAAKLVDVMLPWLAETQKRAYNQNVLEFFRALGRRAWDIAPLQALLEPIIWTDSTQRFNAARYWLAAPHTRVERALSLLERDGSAFLISEVADVLHRQRQDLLSPYLNGVALRGKFASAPRVYLVPRFHDGFHRWTVAQQRTFICTLKGLIRDAKQSTQTRASSIRLIAMLPACKLDDLSEFIDLDEVAIKEAALGATVWLDQPNTALPILLEHTHGDRARVAMYAIPRLAKLLTADTLIQALDTLLARPRIKVTVAKEVMRLLGETRTQMAAERIKTSWEKPHQHRDVRIAILHAAYALIDFDEAQHIISSVSQCDEPEVCRAWLQMGMFHIPTHWRVQVLDWQLDLADRPETHVRQALFSNFYTCAWLIQGQEALQTRLARITSKEVLDAQRLTSWQSATHMLVHNLSAPVLQRACIELVSDLITTRHEPLPDDTRDLPFRQRLSRLVTQLCQAHPMVEDNTLTSYLTDIDWPEDCWDLRSRIAWTLAFRHLGHEVHTAHIIDTLTCANTTLDVHMSLEVHTSSFYGTNLPPSVDALKLAHALSGHAHLMVQQALVDYVSVMGAHYDWTQKWRQALKSCRQSQYDVVRHRALRVAMAVE